MKKQGNDPGMPCYLVPLNYSVINKTLNIKHKIYWHSHLRSHTRHHYIIIRSAIQHDPAKAGTLKIEEAIHCAESPEVTVLGLSTVNSVYLLLLSYAAVLNISHHSKCRTER